MSVCVMMRASALSGFLLLSLIGRGGAEPAPGFLNCSSGVSPDLRQRCDEEAVRQAEKSRTTQLDEGWRLVRSWDPGGGADAVSVMHAVDTRGSDVGLAGLSLQCGRGGIEVVLIVLEALPRTTRPAVVLTAGTKRTEFEASVVQGGQALLLSQDASSLAASEWQSATELSVEIDTKPAPIRGAIPIRGLAAALRNLSQNCPSERTKTLRVP
jgi:hypothetical protein